MGIWLDRFGLQSTADLKKKKEKCALKELCLRPCWHVGAQIMELPQNTAAHDATRTLASVADTSELFLSWEQDCRKNINVNLLFQLQNDAGSDLLRDLL